MCMDVVCVCMDVVCVCMDVVCVCVHGCGVCMHVVCVIGSEKRSQLLFTEQGTQRITPTERLDQLVNPSILNKSLQTEAEH